MVALGKLHIWPTFGFAVRLDGFPAGWILDQGMPGKMIALLVELIMKRNKQTHMKTEYVNHGSSQYPEKCKVRALQMNLNLSIFGLVQVAA